jgi:hypothetical protein
MSIQLHDAMRNILAMPYYKNENARSGEVVHGHEAAVALRIKDLGFTEVHSSQFKKLKSILKKWARSGDDSDLRKATAGIKPGSYILQPSGTQGFPDILVLDFNNRFVAVECKSMKNYCPMWNDSLPNPNALYVLASGKYNETTIFLGRDVISQEEYDLMAEQEEAFAQIVKKYNPKMKSVDVHNRGWLLKSRKQYFQQGGEATTNYFKHENRAICEANALEYANQ